MESKQANILLDTETTPCNRELQANAGDGKSFYLLLSISDGNIQKNDPDTRAQA